MIQHYQWKHFFLLAKKWKISITRKVWTGNDRLTKCAWTTTERKCERRTRLHELYVNSISRSWKARNHLNYKHFVKCYSACWDENMVNQCNALEKYVMMSHWDEDYSACKQTMHPSAKDGRGYFMQGKQQKPFPQVVIPYWGTNFYIVWICYFLSTSLFKCTRFTAICSFRFVCENSSEHLRTECCAKCRTQEHNTHSQIS